jgi:hypothetical protein
VTRGDNATLAERLESLAATVIFFCANVVFG